MAKKTTKPDDTIEKIGDSNASAMLSAFEDSTDDEVIESKKTSDKEVTESLKNTPITDHSFSSNDEDNKKEDSKEDSSVVEALKRKIADLEKEQQAELATPTPVSSGVEVVLIRVDVEPCKIGERWYEFEAGKQYRVPSDVAQILREARKI